MPEHRPGPDAPGRAALATIERIKREIASHPDPETLNTIRAAFRKEIPLNLRSYAAALLILQASSTKGQDGRREGRKSDARQGDGRKSAVPKSDGRRKDGRGGDGPKVEKPRGEGPTPEPRLDENRPRYEGEGTTVFFGMGKRQRLYPRVLYRILTEDAHLAPEEIGDIRSFDNYSFADIDPLCAESLITSLDGYAFRSRGLPVSKARKRGAEADEGEGGASIPGTRTEGSSRDESLDVDGLEDEAPVGDDFTDEYEGVDESFGSEDDDTVVGELDGPEEDDKAL